MRISQTATKIKTIDYSSTVPQAIAREIETPIGVLIAVANEDGICALETREGPNSDKQLEELQASLGYPVVWGDHSHLQQLASELVDYFEGDITEFSVPLVLDGTEFQLKVWKALRQIPHGQAISYTKLAEAIGDKKAVRAVAQANGRNKIMILIPCHRVINADGRLGGYSGGLWRKEILLKIEKITVKQS